MTVTRRLVLSMLSALPLLPRAAMAEDIVARLQRDLDRHLRPGTETTLTVTRVTFTDDRGRTAFKAVVRMAWPPGTRSQAVTAVEPDAETAYASLLRQSLQRVAEVNPTAIA